jgi:hypothetical protein
MLNYRWVLLNICRFICPMSIHVPSSDSTFEMAAAKVGQSWPWPAVQCLSSPKTRFCMGWYRLIIRWYCLVSLVYPNKIFGIIPRTVHFGYYELSHFRTRGRYRRSLLDEGWMLTPGSLPSRLRGVPNQIIQAGVNPGLTLLCEHGMFGHFGLVPLWNSPSCMRLLWGNRNLHISIACSIDVKTLST